MWRYAVTHHNGGMTPEHLTTFSDQLADAVESAARSVVQVRGHRRPASGVVFRDNAVITTGAAIGSEHGITVKTPDGRSIEAELAGWDPATHIAVLRVPELNLPAAMAAERRARVGHLATAIGRSWSNAVTASVGNVAVIGGPLPTGRGRAIEEVIRTTASMHRGFTGGAFIDTDGHVLGINTAAEIRGLGVIIPAAIAWKAASDVLEHGQLRRGYLGLAGQTVRLGDKQRTADRPESALLVVGVTAGSPAEQAGLIVGDIVTSLGGVEIDSTDRLLEALAGAEIGRPLVVRVLRGGQPVELSVTVGERPAE
jgi:S1-C subfamily serine protease